MCGAAEGQGEKRPWPLMKARGSGKGCRYYREDLQKLRLERPVIPEKLVVDEAQAGSLPRQRLGWKPVSFHGNWS